MAYLALEKTSTEGIVQKDERGHHLNRPTKISENTIDTIRSHIKSFELVESHYVRKEIQRQYLPQGLNLAKMYRLYTDWCKENDRTPAKQWLYEQIFNEDFNLGFFRPKKDLCDMCETFKNSSTSEKEQLDCSAPKTIS